MISISQALAEYDASIQPLPEQSVPLAAAHGRVLAVPALAAVDLPLFTQSAVDGYAVRSADAHAGATLQMVGEIPAGSPSARGLAAGQVMRILTGGALPAGADAVARQEIVRRDAGVICLERKIPAGADTRLQGEELRAGECLAKRGQRLNSGLIAALAMANVAQVWARRRARVTVIITGDEVVPAGSQRGPGQVYDANGPLVLCWLRERGIAAPVLHYVADERAVLARVLEDALATSDLVITTGGVSVGDRDYVPDLAPELGVTKRFWKVAQKPGKPLWFGVRGACALLGLPGNPGSVLVGLALHVARILDLMEGVALPSPAWRGAGLEFAEKADRERDRLVRMRVRENGEGAIRLEPLGRQESHMLSNLGTADALAWLPAREAEFAAGEVVRWLPLAASG